MHDTYILKNIFKYLEDAENTSSRHIKKVCIALADFGGIEKEHFLEHYRDLSCGTKWEGVDVEIKNIPYGPELEITKIIFE